MRSGAVAVSPCSTADGPRRSSGTITGGAIPTPLLNLGLSERERVAHCTWVIVSVMYCGPEGQRIRTKPADTSLTLWDAAPYRSPVAKGPPWLAAAVVLRLMRIFFHYFGALVWMEMFILVLCCGAWGKWLIQRCALLSLLLEWGFCLMCAKSLTFWAPISLLVFLRWISAATFFTYYAIRPIRPIYELITHFCNMCWWSPLRRVIAGHRGPQFMWASCECKAGFSRESWGRQCML